MCISIIISDRLSSVKMSVNFSLFHFLANFKKTLREHRTRIKELDDMYIEIVATDSQYVSNDDLCGISGSFRKLEVD